MRFQQLNSWEGPRHRKNHGFVEGSQSIVLWARSSGGYFHGSPLQKAVLPALLGLSGGQEGPGGWASGELGTDRQAGKASLAGV